MATIEILTSECAHHGVVVLGGELDATGTAQVEVAVGDVVAAGRPVILDITDLEFIDCAALGTLLRCRALAWAAGADLLAAAPGGVVMRLLTLTGMEDPVWVYATVAAAAAATCDGTRQ